MKKVQQKLSPSKLCIYAAALSNAITISAMNERKSHLEPIYLANVALYMTEEDLPKLSMVNKKASEAIHIIRRFEIKACLPQVDRGQIDLIKVLCSLKASESKPLMRNNIETLDLHGAPNDCIDIAKQIHDICPEDITRLTLHDDWSRAITYDTFLNKLNDDGFINIQEIELHRIHWRFLLDWIPKDIITCDHINVNTLQHVHYQLGQINPDDEDFICKEVIEFTQTPDNRSFAYIGNSNKRVIVKSINIADADTGIVMWLTRIFPDANIYKKRIEYRGDLDDETTASALSLTVTNQDDALNIDQLCDFILRQYNSHWYPFVEIDCDGLNTLSFEDLRRRQLIETDENGSVSLMKWAGIPPTIGSRPISWKALANAHYYTYGREIVIDITDFQGERCDKLQNFDGEFSAIMHNKSEIFVVNGRNIPLYALPSMAFWDQFFDYSGSEIRIDDIEYEDLPEIPSDIDGTIVFVKNRSDEEKRKIRHRFANTRELHANRKIINAQGYNARDKINEQDLYYSKVDINFPTLAENEVELGQYAVFGNEETAFDDERMPAVVHHTTGPKPTFRYLLKKHEISSKGTTWEIDEQTGEKRKVEHKFTIILPRLQLTGVFDDVYNAKNKRLVIHPAIKQIDFQPRAEAGLTFVLGPNIDYINKEFWQPGNSYILSAWKDRATLAYLKSIQEQHEIDISERPDGFGFWNISKNSILRSTELLFFK